MIEYSQSDALHCSAVIYVIFIENIFENMLIIKNGSMFYTEQQKSKILEITSDLYCRKILSMLKKEPKSVVEISKETKIPISTVYRRLQTLYDIKLLRISGIINNRGKKTFLYKSKIKSVSSFFNGDSIEIKITPNDLETS